MRSGTADQFILRFSHVTATSTPKGQAAAWFKQELERRTESRIRVEVYPNSELYGDKDEMQALQSNSVQMLAPASAKFTTVAPALQSLDLPFLVDELADVPTVVAKESEVGKAIYRNKDLESKGMKVVGLWDSGMKQIHSNDETRKPSDMRGKNTAYSRLISYELNLKIGEELLPPWLLLKSTEAYSKVLLMVVKITIRIFILKRCTPFRNISLSLITDT